VAALRASSGHLEPEPAVGASHHGDPAPLIGDVCGGPGMLNATSTAQGSGSAPLGERPGTLLVTGTASTLRAQGLHSPPNRAVFGVPSVPAESPLLCRQA